MKRLICYISALVGLMAISTACYEDFIGDYEYPSMGFSLSKQVRTVVSTTNKIYVGVSFGGTRVVDDSAWGQFALDESLLDGTGLTLLPESYYKLENLSYFKVRRSDFAVADVGITFTDAFYADEKCRTMYYALPFRLVATSIEMDKKNNKYGSIREGAATSIVAIKYISGLSGTYYKLGEEAELDFDDTVLDTKKYRDKDLSRNGTTTLKTVGRNTLLYTGLGSSTAGSMILDIDYDPAKTEYDIAVTPGEGSAITEVSAKYVVKGDYTFYSGDNIAPQINLEYRYTVAGVDYKVKETLVLRQHAEKELRVETF